MKKNTALYFSVGLVVLLAIFILIFGMIFLNEKDLRETFDVYHLRFTQVSTLVLDDPVKINGVKLGRVENIELSGHRVVVTVRLKSDVKIPKDVALQFVGQALQLEQQNKAMNSFIATLVEKMCKADIYTLLLKGQGIAQCYERPLWRSCGDVDLLLSEDNYLKAKQFLIPLATTVEKEGKYALHLGMENFHFSV